MCPAQAASDTVCIVVPAYNEANRLDRDELKRYLDTTSDVHFLFVDDGSTDATFGMLSELEARFETVHVLRLAQNSGKAEAVRHGVLQAMNEGYSFVGYWDADWATPLSDIDRFVDLLRKRPDLRLALGSRVALLGRNIDRKWYRHYLGRITATFASIVLGIAVYDTQCGAKLMRVSPELKQIFQAEFRSSWVFDVEMIARYLKIFASSQGIYEVPLDRWRDVGDSKVRPIDFVRSFGAMARIYHIYRVPQRYQDALDFITAPFVRYVGAGAIGTAAHYVTVILSVELGGLVPWVGAALGATVGAIINYILNYHFIFASSRPHRATMPRFMTVAALSIAINTCAVKWGASLHIHYLVAQVAGTIVALFVGYALNKAWTFRE